jgi:hypothetical protein
MLVVSEFLITEIKPLIAKLIYDPNDPKTVESIIEKLSQFGQKIPLFLSEGTVTTEHFQRYNEWLKEFLQRMESKDYVDVLQGLNAKELQR